jgi:hypothetical protein
MANQRYNKLCFTGDSAKVEEANLFLSNLPIDEWGSAYIPGIHGYFQDIQVLRCD